MALDGIKALFHSLFGKVDKAEDENKANRSELKDVKEALPAGLSGNVAKVGDDFVSEKETPKNKEKQQGDDDQEKEERGSWWDRNKGLVLGGAAAAIGIGVGVMTGGLGGLAICALGAVVGLSSCSKKDDRYAVIQTVNLNIQNPENEQLINMIDTLTKLVQTIIDKMDDQSQQNAQMIAYLGTISTNLSNLHNLVMTSTQDLSDKLEQIIQLITDLMNNQNMQHEGVMALLATISGQLTTMDENQQNNAQAILEYMHQMDANQQERFLQLLDAISALGVNMSIILEGLGANLENIENLIAQLLEKVNQIQAKLNEINAVISNLNANVQAGFQAIVQATIANGATLDEILEALNGLAGQLNALNTKIDEVITAINNLGAGMQEGFQTMLNAVMQNGATLEEILAMLDHIKNLVTQVSAQVAEGNAQNQQLLNQILGAIQNLSAELQAGIAQILAKLDGMDANQQTAFLEMIQHMIDIKNGQGEQNMQMQTIINLISNLDPGTGCQVDLTPILNAIDNLNNNVTNQSTALGALLAQILGKLDDIDNKVGTIQTIAQSALSVVQHMDGDNHIIIGLLEQIIANQGDYMTGCTECCENVIILLEQILNAITNGTNDEGFTGGEYNDLLG